MGKRVSWNIHASAQSVAGGVNNTKKTKQNGRRVWVRVASRTAFFSSFGLFCLRRSSITEIRWNSGSALSWHVRTFSTTNTPILVCYMKCRSRDIYPVWFPDGVPIFARSFPHLQLFVQYTHWQELKRSNKTVARLCPWLMRFLGWLEVLTHGSKNQGMASS